MQLGKNSLKLIETILFNKDSIIFKEESMQMKVYIKKIFILFIPIVMLCSVLSEYSLSNAEAASNRSIKIEEVRGTVMIQKNGGLKLIRAYEGMNLQQGDRISTNAYSSLRLVIQDTNDEITISENAEFFIANLDEANGEKHTKLTIWNGLIWAKVTPLVNSKDKFEIGTPSSTMNVRGTTLLVGIDPITGESKFFIASGQGVVSQNGQGTGSSTTLLPSQQLVVDGSTQNYDDNLNIVDIDSLLNGASQEIIAAIIKNKAAIDEENAAFILEVQSGLQINQEEINRINQNLQNLIGNIAKEALLQNKISKLDMEELIKKLNEQYGLILDLDKTTPQQLTDAEKEKQAQLKKLEEERKKKAEEEKRKQEELKNQNQNLVNKLQEQLKKQKEQKEKEQEVMMRQKAEEALKRKLDEEAKLALDEKLKALELEKQKQETAAADAKAKAEVPLPTPPSQPSENPGPAPSNVDKNLTNAKATIPASSELYTPESWNQVVFALGLGEASNSEKIEKTEAIKLAVAGLLTIVNQNLMNAKSFIPTNSTLYTPDTWGNVLAALALPETNNSEKVEKTEAIRSAVKGLVEIPIIPEIVIEEPTRGTDYIRVHWNHYADATKYEVYLNDELVGEYDGIMDTYDFTYGMLQPGKSYTLEILALDENSNILAKKTIDFQTNAPIEEELDPTP